MSVTGGFELLTSLDAVGDAEQLRLVVARDGGVGVDVAGQVGQVLGQIGRSHDCFLFERQGRVVTLYLVS